MSFRKVIFWLHLVSGLIAGLVIAVMSFTGAVLAFEHEIVEWAERDVRRITPPSANAAALPLDDLLAKVREIAPADAKPAGVTVSRDPSDAVAVSYGRDGTYYVNQYTGAVVKPAAERTHDFMHLMVDWHRYLAREGDQRPYGKAVTGACNLAFLFLAVSGLWLWWPRAWNARLLRPSLWFVRGATGKARDWNWHNVVGFWSLPILVVLTASGAVIGYKWASDLVYRAAGEQPPAQPSPAAAPADDLKIERPDGASRLTYAAAFARLEETFPAWTTITLREGLPRRRPPAAPVALSVSSGNPAPAAGLPPSGPPASSPPRRPQPYSATIKADDHAPAFATTQVVLNPFTGELLSRLGYDEFSPGRKLRTWFRFLHTGQALGWPGQLLAGLASLGGVLLVYTGFALSWRRFFPRKSSPAIS